MFGVSFSKRFSCYVARFPSSFEIRRTMSKVRRVLQVMVVLPKSKLKKREMRHFINTPTVWDAFFSPAVSLLYDLQATSKSTLDACLFGCATGQIFDYSIWWLLEESVQNFSFWRKCYLFIKFMFWKLISCWPCSPWKTCPSTIATLFDLLTSDQLCDCLSNNFENLIFAENVLFIPCFCK